MVVDFAVEVQRIIGTAGKLLAVRIPRPQRPGESVDV